MFQVLLEDRFHLKVHWETKELPVYLLTVGKNGSKLKPTPPGGEFIKLPDGTTREVHGMTRTERVPTLDDSFKLRFSFQASSMQDAAYAFSSSFDRPVLDQTGLKADYEFVIEFEWPPDIPRGFPGRFPESGNQLPPVVV